MRYLSLLTSLMLAVSAQAQGSTVWITILGPGDADEVTVGFGASLPYALYVETDPLGTPGNFGLERIIVTIDADFEKLGGPRVQGGPAPVSAFFEPFASWNPRFEGCPLLNGDLIAVTAGQPRTTRPSVQTFRPGIGQRGRQPFARGRLTIPRSPDGTVFRVTVYVDPGKPASSSARIITNEALTEVGAPDKIIGSTLTIRIGDPQGTLALPGDLDGDGDVDLADYLEFVDCFTVPQELPGDECDPADLDGDGDVDLADVIAFQGEYTGSL